MAPRPGIPNNPAGGPGQFQKGNSGWDRGPRISAGKRMVDALSRAIMANDGEAVELISKNVVQQAVNGDVWAIEFLFNRIVGRPEVAVNLREEDPAKNGALEEKFTRLIEGLAQRDGGETVQ
jgi:hypothetical protein